MAPRATTAAGISTWKQGRPRARLEQTAAYLDWCGGEAGHLVIFDRAEGRRWEDKLFHRRESTAGYAIAVWGM